MPAPVDSPSPPSRRPRVAILGGGFCGAAAAFHLARDLGAGVEILVVEPRPRLGAGLAYGTEDPAHRINVPSSKMTLVSADLGHFDAWLDGPEAPPLDPEAVSGPDRFPQRRLFGAYVAAFLRPWIEAGVVRHLRDRAVAVDWAADGGVVTLAGGGRIAADLLVLALTHPRPETPGALAPLSGSPGLVADPYAPEALAGVAPGARVLVVGSGLTSADVIASLDRRGHRGPITTLSRHGLRSRGHAPRPQETLADFADPPARTAGGLLASIRAALRADAAAGLTWHAALDRVRGQGPAIWAALDAPARSRIVRHLRTLWDVHRFRVAPQVEAVLDRLTAEGRLTPIAGRLTGARVTPEGLAVSWRPRGAARGTKAVFDAVVVTTGPAHGRVIADTPVLASLAAAGRLRPDPLGLGIDTDPDGRPIGADGRGDPRILVCGPLARGSVGELMGVPEVTQHAELTARRAAAILRGAPGT